MIKGVIIDFNGTLYRDHDLNYEAWKQTFDSVKPKESNESYDIFQENIETLTKDYEYSEAILRLFNKPTNIEKIIEISESKESLYREMAKSQNRNNLMEGANTFLQYLKDNNIPYCIASMAPLSNFKFYLEYLNLKEYFTLDNIVYDSIEYRNKNDQYTEAARRMNIDLSECLLIEDSPKVIMRSLSTNIKNIIYLNSKNKKFNIKEIKQEIQDFREFDYSILKK